MHIAKTTNLLPHFDSTIFPKPWQYDVEILKNNKFNLFIPLDNL